MEVQAPNGVLNGFQCIISKYKNGMVTTGITYLDTVTVIVIVIENILSSLPLGKYLLLVTKLKRYPSRGNNRNFRFTTLLRSANEVWGKVMF